jgi:hypothetical protein
MDRVAVFREQLAVLMHTAGGRSAVHAFGGLPIEHVVEPGNS